MSTLACLLEQSNDDERGRAPGEASGGKAHVTLAWQARNNGNLKPHKACELERVVLEYSRAMSNSFTSVAHESKRASEHHNRNHPACKSSSERTLPGTLARPSAHLEIALCLCFVTSGGRRSAPVGTRWRRVGGPHWRASYCCLWCLCGCPSGA